MKNEFLAKGLILSSFLHIALTYVLIDGLSVANVEDLSIPGVFMLFLFINLATLAIMLIKTNHGKGDLIKLELGQFVLSLIVALSVFLYIQDFFLPLYVAIIVPAIALYTIIVIVEAVLNKKTA